MSDSKFSSETIHRIYNDKTGEYIEVGPDADTGDLLELRQVEGDKIVARIAGYPDQLRLVAEAILKSVEPSWLIALYEEKRLLTLVDKLSSEQLMRLSEINARIDEHRKVERTA